ncbi:autophagy-related protein 9A [Condylostylus longicornis]|uniref:autophagy-related protein 9A n=1 Tax=Condylostylus longicornis TaxID=2530218 RepID=UPI00244DC48D|nr:autophagy-related protein 9A [Condylostylus longicornis]XP_055380394.1 autophagy-related protein 9A [Condylostylus longicornis]XP_055380396.1 autophagy-related protein 9A [Condylostylus longicornis]
MGQQDEFKYDSIKNDVNPFTTFKEEHDFEDYKNEDSPMIHVVPDSNKLRWNHIEDLDSFFTRMYSYHQKHGFLVIILDEILQQISFVFVVWIAVFTTHCINYPVLFGDDSKNSTKVYLSDVFVSFDQCVTNFSSFTIFCLILASIFFIFRFVKILYHASQYWDIKKFYNTALKIEDNELDNLTWHEVQKKIREVQSEQQMCIHKDNLTELDIYHRILRFKNYMVALMNKNLLPTRYSLPIFGEMVSLTRGLLYNIELILFRGPWSLFENNWQLRGDLAVRSNRLEFSKKLSTQIVWLAIANFLLSPFIFLWQLTYISFNYATILKREPGSLGARTWSNYGRLCLRHFNELDHELDARLNRAYEPAEKYMSSFSSPLVTVFAKHLLFICGGLLVVIVALGVYEEHVFQVEHVLTIVTILSGIGVICRISLPDENLVWCPEQLLTAVLAHVHYLPTSWKNLAHTTLVRKEFENFFQFKAVYLLNEIFSPITTPFILLFIFRPRALDIVDFFRSFTVSVVGVGNVCSFAQMDVRKHGNPEWQLATSSECNISNENPIDVNNDQQADTLNRGENGKTELSLVHFTLTNPEWRMPPESKQFMMNIKQQALLDLKGLEIEPKNKSTAMDVSLMSFGSIGEKYSSIANSVFQHKNLSINGLADSIMLQKQPLSSIDTATPSTSFPFRQQQVSGRGVGGDFEKMLHQNLSDGTSLLRPLESIEESQIYDEYGHDDKNQHHYEKVKSKKVRKGVTHNEGSADGSKEGLLYSLYTFHPELSIRTDLTTADMCLSTLYLHELHHRQMQRKCERLAQHQSALWQKSQIVSKSNIINEKTRDSPNSAAAQTEKTPLLLMKKS